MTPRMRGATPVTGGEAKKGTDMRGLKFLSLIIGVGVFSLGAWVVWTLFQWLTFVSPLYVR